MSNQDAPVLHAFTGYGIELEYMIVDSERLDVLPVADRLLRGMPEQVGNDVRHGLLDWSNEMMLHVIELKNPRPTATLGMLPDAFQNAVRRVNDQLQQVGARLMPGAMHPWMDPRRETRLWPHDNAAIYRAYDRIFDCTSHGWANLQSMHINLPFADDDEFARLHAAIRLVLPVLPALAASSPIADGRVTGWADYRMRMYCDNAAPMPSLVGAVIPDTVDSRATYEEQVLTPMYRDVAPHDPEQVLRHEWLNSHGAIARFDRHAIEIRVIDTQECPHADLAIAAITAYLVRTLYHAEDMLDVQQQMPTAALAAILQACIRDAEQSVIDNAQYLRLLGYPERRCSANELWHFLIERMLDDDSEDAGQWHDALKTILHDGPLARRILKAAGAACPRNRLQRVYRELCDCLQQGIMFEGRI